MQTAGRMINEQAFRASPSAAQPQQSVLRGICRWAADGWNRDPESCIDPDTQRDGGSGIEEHWMSSLAVRRHSVTGGRARSDDVRDEQGPDARMMQDWQRPLGYEACSPMWLPGAVPVKAACPGSGDEGGTGEDQAPDAAALPP
ncbi:hypothetical protein FQA39_LY19440 [Lamprigera yunnana]|nr:hypothetical protein FQA39_LY19440 [Lamprigera yunnana]